MTANVLECYLAGLLFAGLSKLFSLWLYGQEKVKVSATISTYSLIAKMVSLSILIEPFGVLGLALSTTISSSVSLPLIIREFGWRDFRDIILKRF